MKNIIFSFALLVAFVVKGQNLQMRYFNYTAGQITLDSVLIRAPYSYPTDSMIIYYSSWTSSEYMFEDLQCQCWQATQTWHWLKSSQLDSANGAITLKWANEGPGQYYCSMGNVIGFNINYEVTSITQAIQQQKTGTVTIYDSQGRFIKTSSVSEYTQGLTPGALYIYNAVYSDNTFDKGKFIIE